MNTEASKREGGRSDWVKDEEGWKSVVTTPDLPNWTPGDTVGELTGSMAYPEDLDSPSSDGTQDRLGRLTWRRAGDNPGGHERKHVNHTPRERKRAKHEERQEQENMSHTPTKDIANPLAAPAGKPEYVESLGSDTRSRSRPTVKSSGTYSDSKIEPELGYQYPEWVHTQWHPKDPTFAENAGAGDKVMRELRSRSGGGRRRPASPSSSERDTEKPSRRRSRVPEDDAAALSAAAATGIQQHKERQEKRKAERESQRKRERPQLSSFVIHQIYLDEQS